MKYIFKQIDNISGRCAETTVEFSADSLSDILEQFEMFLRGSGFLPDGTLDFIPDEEYYGEPETQEEPVHPWTQTLRDDGEWNGVAPSVAMQWTVNELTKGPMTVQSITEKCPICGISLESMKNQKCWDVKCPIGNNAN